MTSKKEKQWYLMSDQQEIRGPFQRSEIIKEIIQGRLGPQNLLRSDASDPDDWDYLFSYVEFKDAVPKPVINKKLKVENLSQFPSLFMEQESKLMVIIHDKVRIYEGKVSLLKSDAIEVSGIDARKFKSDGAKVFIHLHDPQLNSSVNLWAEVDNFNNGILALKIHDQPQTVAERYLKLVGYFSQRKVA